LPQEDENGEWQIFRAAESGEMRAVIDGQPISIRIARAGYCGMLKYRYLEEGNDA
jgi:hypothetical protein